MSQTFATSAKAYQLLKRREGGDALARNQRLFLEMDGFEEPSQTGIPSLHARVVELIGVANQHTLEGVHQYRRILAQLEQYVTDMEEMAAESDDTEEGIAPSDALASALTLRRNELQASLTLATETIQAGLEEANHSYQQHCHQQLFPSLRRVNHFQTMGAIARRRGIHSSGAATMRNAFGRESININMDLRDVYLRQGRRAWVAQLGTDNETSDDGAVPSAMSQFIDGILQDVTEARAAAVRHRSRSSYLPDISACFHTMAGCSVTRGPLCALLLPRDFRRAVRTKMRGRDSSGAP